MGVPREKGATGWLPARTWWTPGASGGPSQRPWPPSRISHTGSLIFQGVSGLFGPTNSYTCKRLFPLFTLWNRIAVSHNQAEFCANLDWWAPLFGLMVCVCLALPFSMSAPFFVPCLAQIFRSLMWRYWNQLACEQHTNAPILARVRIRPKNVLIEGYQADVLFGVWWSNVSLHQDDSFLTCFKPMNCHLSEEKNRYNFSNLGCAFSAKIYLRCNQGKIINLAFFKKPGNGFVRSYKMRRRKYNKELCHLVCLFAYFTRHLYVFCSFLCSVRRRCRSLSDKPTFTSGNAK